MAGPDNGKFVRSEFLRVKDIGIDTVRIHQKSPVRDPATFQLEAELVGNRDDQIGAIQSDRLRCKRGIVENKPGAPIFRGPGLRPVEFQNHRNVQFSSQKRAGKIVQRKSLIDEGPRIGVVQRNDLFFDHFRVPIEIQLWRDRQQSLRLESQRLSADPPCRHRLHAGIVDLECVIQQPLNHPGRVADRAAN